MAKKSKRQRKKENLAKLQSTQPSSKSGKKSSRRKKHSEAVAEQKAKKQARKELNQRKTTLPVSRLTDKEFEEWKDKLQPVVESANYRIQELHSQGLTTVELERYQNGDAEKMFNIDDITDPNELRAVMTQVRTFLNDAGDSSNKAFLESAMLSAELYRGQFGGQYKEEGKRFNLHDIVDDSGNLIRSSIDPDIASRAFRAYRNLESTYASVIGRQGGDGVYGSENLIIAIYDMEARGMDGQVYGRDLLETWMDEYLKELEGINFSLSDAEAIIGSWNDFIDRRYF